jgi:hypothetical protein
MLTVVRLYAGSTFVSCLRVTSGASAPHPSPSSVSSLGAAPRAREPKGLNPLPPPAWREGWKAGFDATGGGGPLDDEEEAPPPEYFEPDASATLRTMLSGVRSLSVLATICT